MHRRLAIALVLLVASTLLSPSVRPAAAAHDWFAPGEIPIWDFTYHPTTAGRSGHRTATLWANGSLTGTVDLPERASALRLLAQASYCDGPATFEVRVDGTLVMAHPVVSSGSYVVPGDWGPGERHVSVRFTNDRLTDTCDRNLHVTHLRFLWGETAHQTSQTADLRRAAVRPVTAGRIAHGFPGRWSGLVWGPGALVTELDGLGTDLQIDARTPVCGGKAADVAVRVDGRTVHTGPLPPRTTIPDVRRAGDPPLHTIEVELLDPFQTEICSRFAQVTRVAFVGTVPASSA